jgi:hypothetical protein
VTVTRRGSDLYEVNYENAYAETRFCFEFVSFEPSTLAMSGTVGELTFRSSGRKCTVKGVYSSVALSAGSYLVQVTREADDWYSLLVDFRLRTQFCFEFSVSSQATLVWDGFQTGRLIFQGGSECSVTGVYSRRSFP